MNAALVCKYAKLMPMGQLYGEPSQTQCGSITSLCPHVVKECGIII